MEREFPFLAELKFMEEPTDENIRIYQAINNEIEKFNFHAVANYYRNMKMKDFSFFFYDELGDLINLTNILEINSESFYKSIANFLERIFTHNFSEKIVVEKISIVLRLALLIDYKDIENPKFKFTNEEIEQEKKEFKKI